VSVRLVCFPLCLNLFDWCIPAKNSSHINVYQSQTVRHSSRRQQLPSLRELFSFEYKNLPSKKKDVMHFLNVLFTKIISHLTQKKTHRPGHLHSTVSMCRIFDTYDIVGLRAISICMGLVHSNTKSGQFTASCQSALPVNTQSRAENISTKPHNNKSTSNHIKTSTLDKLSIDKVSLRYTKQWPG